MKCKYIECSIVRRNGSFISRKKKRWRSTETCACGVTLSAANGQRLIDVLCPTWSGPTTCKYDLKAISYIFGFVNDPRQLNQICEGTLFSCRIFFSLIELSNPCCQKQGTRFRDVWPIHFRPRRVISSCIIIVLDSSRWLSYIHVTTSNTSFLSSFLHVKYMGIFVFHFRISRNRYLVIKALQYWADVSAGLTFSEVTSASSTDIKVR